MITYQITLTQADGTQCEFKVKHPSQEAMLDDVRRSEAYLRTGEIMTVEALS